MIGGVSPTVIPPWFENGQPVHDCGKPIHIHSMTVVGMSAGHGEVRSWTTVICCKQWDIPG